MTARADYLELHEPSAYVDERERDRKMLTLSPPEIALMRTPDGRLPRGLSLEQREVYAAWVRETDERGPSQKLLERT